MRGKVDLSRLGPIDVDRLETCREQALEEATGPDQFIDEDLAAREYTRLVSSMPGLAQAVLDTIHLSAVLKADIKAHVGGSKSPVTLADLNGVMPAEAREVLEETAYVRDFFRLRAPGNGWDTIRRDYMERDEWRRARELRRDKQQENGRMADTCQAIIDVADAMGLSGRLAPQILLPLEDGHHNGGDAS